MGGTAAYDVNVAIAGIVVSARASGMLVRHCASREGEWRSLIREDPRPRWTFTGERIMEAERRAGVRGVIMCLPGWLACMRS